MCVITLSRNSVQFYVYIHQLLKHCNIVSGRFSFLVIDSKDYIIDLNFIALYTLSYTTSTRGSRKGGKEERLIIFG